MRYISICFLLLGAAASPSLAQTAVSSSAPAPLTAAEVKSINKEIARIDRQIEHEYIEYINARSAESMKKTIAEIEELHGSNSRRPEIPRDVGQLTPRLQQLTQERAALKAKLTAQRIR